MLAATDLAPRGIEAQVADLEHGGPLGPPATGERTQARLQLGERERLDEVVVGAAVEPGDAIVDRLERGEHQHRRPHPALAQLPADVEAGRVRAA